MARQQRNSTFIQESTRPITHIALYARVSTLNNQDPEMQLSELREYAGRRGGQIVEEFTDQGVSGCKESRPALKRLMTDACRRRFDAILVWKIDRFGRSLKHLVNATFTDSGVDFRWQLTRTGKSLPLPSCPGSLESASSMKQIHWGNTRETGISRICSVSTSRTHSGSRTLYSRT